MEYIYVFLFGISVGIAIAETVILKKLLDE